MKKTQAFSYLAAVPMLCCGPSRAADPSKSVERALEALSAVHQLSEVVLSPDGKRLVYSDVVAGKRGGADVDAAALWVVNALDGSGAKRLTACPGSVCDEHSATWSPDGTRIAFVTTNASEQTQVAVATIAGGRVDVITRAHGPLDTLRFSPDGTRIAFLYSIGAPKTPGAAQSARARRRGCRRDVLRAAPRGSACPRRRSATARSARPQHL